MALIGVHTSLRHTVQVDAIGHRAGNCEWRGWVLSGRDLDSTHSCAGRWLSVHWMEWERRQCRQPTHVSVELALNHHREFFRRPASVTITSNVSAQFTVAGSGCPAGTYTASTSIIWTSGVACIVTAITPQGGPDTRQVFASWTDGLPMNSRSVTASPGAVFGLLFTAEHKLTRTTAGPGTISGSDGYYASGSTVQLTATPSAGYQFTGWSGSASGVANPLTVTMDAAKTITANFVAAPTSVRIESNISTPFSVSGAGCPAGSYTTPATITWTTGTSCDITVPRRKEAPTHARCLPDGPTASR